MKARQYLIKHNIVKKRETFNRPLRRRSTKAGDAQPSPSTLTRFLKKLNREAQAEANSISPADRLPLRPTSTAAHVFYGSNNVHKSEQVLLPPSTDGHKSRGEGGCTNLLSKVKRSTNQCNIKIKRREARFEKTEI